MLAVVTPAALPLEKELPGSSLDLSTIRALPVQHNGRWMPLDTVARDVVESVTGSEFHRGIDPTLLLLSWTLESQTWMQEPLITIANAELRSELELSNSQTVFSYTELVNHKPLLSLIDGLAHAGGGKLDPLQSKVADINKKLWTLDRVFSRQIIRPIPDPADSLGAWFPITAMSPTDSDDIVAVKSAWAALGSALVIEEADAFAEASGRLVESLGKLPTAFRPDSKLLETELRYNKLRPFRTAWYIMVVGAVLAASRLLVRWRSVDAVAVIVMLAGFGVLTYGLLLRWQIAGRIPASNMFESLLFLSWGMGAAAILSMFVLRDRFVPLTASAMGALALILADCLPLDHFIRPIPPVLLDTIWMSIHVPIIMVSYSVLTLAVLIAHVQLVVLACAPTRSGAIKTIDSLHYWYMHAGSILLLAGIITGSMWAASSWGRYWGWDPKEVWSLVAFLAYITIMHVRIGPRRASFATYAVGLSLIAVVFVLVAQRLAPLDGGKLAALGATAAAVAMFVLSHGMLATALKSIVAFWLIIMTYLGVNYVLGTGLHTYGFGTGAVMDTMIRVGAIDLCLMVVLSAVHLARRPAQAPPAGGRLATSTA